MSDAEHEASIWCWCRPKIVDAIVGTMIVHRDIDPSVLAVRYLWGGEALAPDDGLHATPWWNEYPGWYGRNYQG
jgi:hypothetical protein